MKKVLLSAAVIVVFVAYSYHSRHDDASQVALKVKTPAVDNTQNAVTPSPVTTTPPTPTTTQTSGKYKDGTYTGSVADAFYGLVQVRVAIQGGKIASIDYLQRPDDNPTTRAINGQADPMLVQEAIAVQSARVDVISGATDTSLAFVQSLTAALANAS